MFKCLTHIPTATAHTSVGGVFKALPKSPRRTIGGHVSVTKTLEPVTMGDRLCDMSCDYNTVIGI